VIESVVGNSLQGSAPYKMVVLDKSALNPDVENFTVKGDEDRKQIHLSFYLPVDFNDAGVVTINGLASPDAYISGSSSLVTRGESGEHKVELTLYVSERVLDNGGSNWKTLVKELAFEGFIVNFRDGSGEEVRFAKALPLEEMKRETESVDSDDSGGGGCNTGWNVFLSIPFIATIFFRLKERN
jgi:hypothetical protein